MSITKIIVSVLIAGAIVGGIFFLKSDKVSESEIANQQQNQEDSQNQNTETNSKKMAFADFVKQGGSYECTIKQYVAGTETSGTAFIGEGMIRGEYSTQTQGLTVNTSVIVRDGFAYTWTSMAPTMGFKAKVVEDTTTNAATSISGSYSFNAEQIGDYDCKAWAFDAGKFTLPAGVTFREV